MSKHIATAVLSVGALVLAMLLVGCSDEPSDSTSQTPAPATTPTIASPPEPADAGTPTREPAATAVPTQEPAAAGTPTQRATPTAIRNAATGEASFEEYLTSCQKLFSGQEPIVFREGVEYTNRDMVTLYAEMLSGMQEIGPSAEVVQWQEILVSALRDINETIARLPKDDPINVLSLGLTAQRLWQDMEAVETSLTNAVRERMAEAGCLVATADFFLWGNDVSGIADDHGNDIGSATIAAVGSAAVGSLEYGGDVDYFRFRAEEGEVYKIEVSLGTLSEFFIGVVNDRGAYIETVFGSSDSPSSPTIWEAPDSGDYYVAVGSNGWGNAGVGSYTLRVAVSDADLVVSVSPAPVATVAPAVPTAAPVATVAPAVPTAVPASSDAMFAIDRDTAWGELFDAFPPDEQACVRGALGQSLDTVRTLPALTFIEGEDEEAVWGITVIECLEDATADRLFLALLSVDSELEAPAEDCLRDLLAATDLAKVMRVGLEDPENPEFHAFGDELFGCLGYLLPEDEPASSLPPPLGDSLLWQYRTDDPDEMVVVSPTEVEGVVFAGSNKGRMYALDAKTGDLLWSFKTDWDSMSPMPLAAGDIVYALDTAGYFALDAYTGDFLGRRDFTYLVVTAEVVYQGTQLDKNLEISAVDVDSGARLWDTEVTRSTDLPLLFPITAAGSNLYVSDGFEVHALDSTTGSLAWTFDAGDILPAPPAALDGVVYMQSYSEALALDETTGEVLWRAVEEYGAQDDRSPFIVDGVWPLVSLGGVARALDAATGQELWSSDKDDPIYVGGVTDGLVFVIGLWAFHALDAATGAEVWSLAADWGFGEVEVVEGALYANSLGGNFDVLDAYTGDLIWTVDIGYLLGGRHDPFIVSGGVVYVGYIGGVYAFFTP